MDSNAVHETIIPEIACSLSASELGQREVTVGAVLADAIEATELPDGYSFAFEGKRETITRLVAIVVAERDCCPFFTFTLAFEANRGSVVLSLQGPASAKDFIRGTMLPSHLEGVAGVDTEEMDYSSSDAPNGRR